MKKLTIVTSGLLLIVIILAVAQVMMTNILSTDGAQLSKLQAEVEKYKRENALLNEKILQASSLTTISEKATEQGFALTAQTYLSTPLPLALKQ